jgi:hypothetical protein
MGRADAIHIQGHELAALLVARRAGIRNELAHYAPPTNSMASCQGKPPRPRLQWPIEAL